jgi:uncharacterized protein (TIGR02646 family)
MIQITTKTQIPVPAILETKGTAAANTLKDRYNAGERDFGGKNDFKSNIYGHATVKEALQTAQHYKCCYCESKFTATSYGDVEHFRPKAGWMQQKKEPLNKPGYYWLAYDWDNLLFSCQICNQDHKRNQFPLVNEASRAASHQDDINNEQPLFIHPANEDPAAYIVFKEDIPVAINGNEKGAVTIKRLGLDRGALNDDRLTLLNKVKLLYDLAKGIPDTMANIRNLAVQQLELFFHQSQSGQAEFAAMLRAFFINNPLDF